MNNRKRKILYPVINGRAVKLKRSKIVPVTEKSLFLRLLKKFFGKNAFST